METLAAIAARRSVRRFQRQAPSPEQLETVLEAAVRAPSAGNVQPWHFYVVRGRAAREALAAAASQEHVARAPVVIVVCADPGAAAGRYGSRGRKLYCIQDTAAAVENMLLAAVDLGLGGCWVGAFSEKKVARIVGAPRGLRPVVLVTLGYPERTASRRTSRRPLSQVVSFVD